MLTFPYYEYNTNYNEPHNIIILNNFIENIDTIQSALGKTDHTNYCLRRCYIYECIDIYKKMNKQYCNKQGNKNFSPVGSMLRSRLQCWNRKNNNVDEEQELLFHGTVNNNAYSDNMEYHIQYQSIGDT
ncbi:hypothetical protein POCGH01_00153700 [Plasmodium ovale]|uniref:PIR Superfamily Protein n=2 Tax=Plasmodium ovale TaxID=36330 RepID=A0A1A8X4J5_PLAOA|nr:PIR Superfamily Protein [Plasmodium ovale curtisi]SBT00190.1 PIR Superfamily Protein [Plasmodium ovale curtisi]SBT83858.1 hypothetical protein POCGH01_00153700 [Plasmodium ovale]